MAESPRRSAATEPARWLPAVVAVVLGLTIGTVIVTNGADSAPTAPTLSSITTNPVVVAPGQSLPEVGAGAEPTTYFGDLGPVDAPSRLRAAVTSAQNRGPVTPGLATAACVRVAPRAVGLLVIGAYATGTAGGAPVTVLVGVAADGVGIAVVLRASDCTIVQRVPTGT